MDTKSATIPVTLLEYLIEYASELRALWDWKVGSTERNDRDVAELEQMIEEAKRVVLQPSSDSTDDTERLAEIRGDALSETYGGELNFGHVSLRDVLDWIRIMSPVYAAKAGWAPLMECDVDSILRTFEEWAQGKHDADLSDNPAT